MKIIKWIVIVILAILAIIAIYGATQPSQMQLEESIEINASASQVFDEIKDFEAWDKWSAWSKMDPDMAQTYEGEVGEIGYKNSWVSENQMVGIGSQEVVEIREDEFMKTKMLFNGQPAANYATFKLSENEGNTVVVWDMLGAETPFYARIMNVIFKPIIRESYQTSLKELKAIVESKPKEIANPLNLEVVEVESMKIISIRDTTTPDGIGLKLRELCTELSIYLSNNVEIETVGKPIGIYHFYSDEMVDMEAAFSIKGDSKDNGRVKVGTTPRGKALKGIHIGNYDASGVTHMAMEEYVNANEEIEFEGICWEIYLNEESTVDSTELKTEIYYQLK